MFKKTIVSICSFILIVLLAGSAIHCFRELSSIGYYRSDREDTLLKQAVGVVSQIGDMHIVLDDEEILSYDDGVYINEELDIMIPAGQAAELLGCQFTQDDNNGILLTKYGTSISMEPGGYYFCKNGMQITVSSSIEIKDGTVYMPVSVISIGFGYSYEWSVFSRKALLKTPIKDGELPAVYDMRDDGRCPEPKNQGSLGTCWAFATLMALESSLLPDEAYDFSEDHLSINNSFGLSQNDGGYYMMAMAYLTAWQGPVLEADDPYGDGVSVDGLSAVKHLQEIQVLPVKDYEQIKQAVYNIGGVQSSLYSSLVNSSSTSEYYNHSTFGYCYTGDQDANHDIVIIGWDDTYPRQNFNNGKELLGDGAFLCMNSWGSKFADNGVFYVSYYDTNIGINNLVYSRIEEPDNYDNIYQADLCGWLGQLGFDDSTAWFANAYTADTAEMLEAVGFYATGENTEYEVYFVADMQDKNSLKEAVLLTSGTIKNKGYYTIDLPEAVTLGEGQKFAVMVRIITPDAVHPIAVEYVSDDAEITPSVDSSDGEGYISSNGRSWQSIEENFNCNICLKAFTSNIE